jgi:tetratricopeptide (TPR) repeat protein
VLKAGVELSKQESGKLDFTGGWILARLAADAKKTPEVVTFYRFAMSERRDKPAITALLYEELGAYLMTSDQFAEALEVYQEAAAAPALSEAKPKFLFHISQAREFSGETDAALAAIKEAQKLVPDSAFLQYQEGWIHSHAQNWDEAIQVFEKVIAQNPEDKEILRRCQFSLSNIHVQRGDIASGEKILEKILIYEPNDPSVNNDLGYLYADQGKDLEKAEKMIRKAVDAEPENPAYLDSMGWVLYKLGRFSEAVEFLQKAVKQPSGSDATIWDHLGDCYDRLEKTDDAVKAWTTALEHARKEKRRDEKVIGRIEEKLKNKNQGPGNLKTEPADAP